jgi:hypothetical protein
MTEEPSIGTESPSIGLDWDASINEPKRPIRKTKGKAGQTYRQQQGEPEPPPKSRRERMQDLFNMISVPTLMVQPADGAALIEHAPSVSKATAELAASDERFAKIIDRFLQTGPYGAFVMAVAPLLFQLAANHGLVPKSIIERSNIRSAEEMESTGKAILASILITSQQEQGTNGQDPSGAEAPTD